MTYDNVITCPDGGATFYLGSNGESGGAWRWNREEHERREQRSRSSVTWTNDDEMTPMRQGLARVIRVQPTSTIGLGSGVSLSD